MFSTSSMITYGRSLANEKQLSSSSKITTAKIKFIPVITFFIRNRPISVITYNLRRHIRLYRRNKNTVLFASWPHCTLLLYLYLYQNLKMDLYICSHRSKSQNFEECLCYLF